MYGRAVLLASMVHLLFLSDAEELARLAKLVERRRKLTGSIFSQILVFGWLAKPRATLKELAAFAFAQGIDVSFQAIDNHINEQGVVFFQQLLCSALESSMAPDAETLPLLQRFEGVYAIDTTDVPLAKCMVDEFPSANPGKAACGIVTCLEVSQGGVVDLQVGPALNNDLTYDLAHTSLPVGSLRLADLGFFNIELLQSYDTEGVFYISRYKPNLMFTDVNGQKFKLQEYLRQQTDDVIDTWIFAGKQKVKTRMVAVRLSAAAAARRREKCRSRNKAKGKPTSAVTLELCSWDVSITNVKEDKLQWREVVTLKRVRWQVELLFKAWKSVGGLEHLTGRTRERVLVELYAKLLGKVVESWHLALLMGNPVRWSWHSASQQLQQWWPKVMACLGDETKLVAWLMEVGAKLQKTAKKERRKKRPLAWQTLLDKFDPRWADGSAYPETDPSDWFANRKLDPDPTFSFGKPKPKPKPKPKARSSAPSSSAPSPVSSP